MYQQILKQYDISLRKDLRSAPDGEKATNANTYLVPIRRESAREDKAI